MSPHTKENKQAPVTLKNISGERMETGFGRKDFWDFEGQCKK